MTANEGNNILENLKNGKAVASIGLDVNLTPLSAAYLALALIIPVIVYFIFRKNI